MTFLLARLRSIAARLPSGWGRFAAFAFVGALFVLMPSASPAQAFLGFVGDVIAAILDFFVKGLGFLLLAIIRGLVSVAQYSNFVAPGPTAVRFGWVVVRDLSNMFFILILLIIAFATILSYEEYNYRKLLPRLFIMAVVINFSKTICGIFIDFGQVVMLTFVNGFIQTAGGNFVNMFHLREMVSMSAAEGQTGQLIIGLFLAFILLTVACAVTLVLLVMLLFRIVMLWVLIILSPLAFLASTFPPAKQYYAQWWKEFRAYIVTGPIVAFFLWLALVSAQQAPGSNIAKQDGFIKETASDVEVSAAALKASGGSGVRGFPTEAGKDDVLISFIVAIALLLAGLKVAIESGTMGAGFASKLKGGMAGFATKAIRGTAGMGFGAAKGALKYGGKQLARPVLAGTGKLAGSRFRPLAAIGRAAGLKSESWADERRKGVEGRWGSIEDMQRLSPQALATVASKTKDPRQLERVAKAVNGSPAAMQALQGIGGARSMYERLEAAADKDPSKRGLFEEFASKNMGVAHAVSLAKAGDKAKADGFNETEYLKNTTFGKLAAKMSGDDALKAFKDSPQMIYRAMPFLSGSAISSLGAKGSDEVRQAVTGSLKDMSAGPDGEKAVLDFLNRKNVSATEISADMMGAAGVAKYVHSKIKDNPAARAEVMGNKEKAALVNGYVDDNFARLNKRAEDGDKDLNAAEYAKAIEDAVSFGRLSADQIMGSATIKQAAIKNLDMGSLARRYDPSDNTPVGATAVGATKALFATVMASGGKKAENLNKNGNYNHLIDDDMVESMKAAAAPAAAVAAAAVSAAPPPPVVIDTSGLKSVFDAVGKRLSQLGETLKGPSSPFSGENQAEFDQLTATMNKLTAAVTARNQAANQVAKSEEFISNMSDETARRSAEAAADKNRKQMEDLGREIAKLTSELKGKV